MYLSVFILAFYVLMFAVVNTNSLPRNASLLTLPPSERTTSNISTAAGPPAES